MITVILTACAGLQAGGELTKLAVHQLPTGPFAPWFGARTTALEDVDLDGVQDYAISSREETYGGVWLSGAVRVYSGSTHALLATLSNSAYQEYFGFELCSAGDVDRDGRGDVAIAGRVANQDNTIQVFSPYLGTRLWTMNVPMVVALSNGGDLDGDGWDEILVGSAATLDGEVRVLAGKDGRLMGVKHALSSYSRFGASVANAGDLDGDGFPETIVGAVQFNSRRGLPDGSGKVYVFSFHRGELLHEFPGVGIHSLLGYSVAGGKDVDGDGVPDILAGAPGNVSNWRSHCGAVLFSGATGERIWEMRFDNAYSAFGHDVALLDDADGDGRADLLIGVPGYYRPGMNVSGAAMLVSGKTLRVLAVVTHLQALFYDQIGWSVTGLDDLDGDGRTEFLIGGAVNLAGVLAFNPFLTANEDRLSIAAGGVVRLRVHFPRESAGNRYRILASLGGSDPGTKIGGWQVELHQDGILSQCLRGNYPSYAHGWSGVLDGTGDALASFTPGPGQLPALVAGRTLSLVAIEGFGGVVQNASALRQILLEP